MKKIKFGVIGLGRIGVRHRKCIIENKRSELTSIFDIVSPNEFNISKEIQMCTSYHEFLQSDVDVINICTPNYLHADMAIDCLNADKHVVIEKPMALSSNKAELIINTASKCNKLVFCVMQNRFSPTMVWLKNVVEKKMLGKINMVAVNCFWNRNKDYYLKSNWHGSKLKDGGPLYTQFSHFIDIMYWLFGPIKNVKADFFSFTQKKYIEFEDSGILHLNFENNIVAALNYSTAVCNTNLESSITILGDQGSIKIGGQYMDKLLYCDINNYLPPDLNNNIQCNDYGAYTGSASNHDKMIDNVVDVLMHNNVKIHTNAIDGLNVVKIIEKIYSFRN